MGKSIDLLQGTLDLLILKTLDLEPMHGWGISQRIQQVSESVLQVNQGSLYPVLHRLKRARLDCLIVENVGEQSPGEILRAHAPRTQATGGREGQLAEAFGSCRPD